MLNASSLSTSSTVFPPPKEANEVSNAPNMLNAYASSLSTASTFFPPPKTAYEVNNGQHAQHGESAKGANSIMWY
ncbi:hypothetical protein T492DRAFT_344599 [Pavlovales sp. CCMP2436]|nr:hypothetical protein T492DRAFT_344599 [Pavlovales sp. CCMP2436]